MPISNEDNLSLEEVLEICRSVKKENIEIDTDPITRPKNVAFLDKYVLSVEDVRQIIRNLELIDYVKGPVEDYNPKFKHPFWVFIKDLKKLKVVVYIKLKIFNHKKKINVFSIHEEGDYELWKKEKEPGVSLVIKMFTTI